MKRPRASRPNALKPLSLLMPHLQKIGQRSCRMAQWLGQVLKIQIRKLLTRAKQKWRTIFWLLLTLVLLLICTLGTVIPSNQVFEGSLVLHHLSFTSPTQQPFLKNIRSISELSGVGALPLSLTGSFSNQPSLKNLNKLDLHPLSDQATWQIIAPSNDQLEVEALSLSPSTKVEQLSYDPYNRRLTLRLTPNQTPVTLTLNPSGLLQVTLQGYQIPPKLEPSDPLTFTWNPNNQFLLKIQHRIQLDLKLNQPSDELFWGKLDVQNVRLKELSIEGTAYENNYAASAIASGTVRLANQNYTLEEGQFLSFQPADSIRTLSRLRLSNETAPTLKTSDSKTLQIGEPIQGLKVDVSGETKAIRIGLNEDLAISKLQASWLEGFMSKEVYIAVTTFLTTLLLALIAKLLGVSL
jgi:hypothetical protein